jgi:hypothetical protein
MAKYVDSTLQDAKVLLKTAQKYSDELVEYGVSSAELDALQTLIAELSKIDGQQKGKKTTVGTETESQNSVIAAAKKKIKLVRDTAKNVFKSSPAIQKEFHIGEKSLMISNSYNNFQIQ